MVLLAKLTAFNVQGDAFLLETEKEPEGKAFVLIDGGKGENFGEKFRAELADKNIKLVVCTHTDSDHANGIISFFKSGFTCEEIWLPALWTSNLLNILNGEKFLKGLATDLKAELKTGSASNFEKKVRERVEEEKPVENLEAKLKTLSEDKDRILGHLKPTRFILSYPIDYYFKDFEYVNTLLSFFDYSDLEHRTAIRDLYILSDVYYDQITNAALTYYGKIVTLLLYALLRGVKKIRWWDYVDNNFDIKNKIDLSNELVTPLCHKELSGFVKDYGELFAYTLSPVNKQSIVLFSKQDNILFCADSDLTACSYIPTPTKENILITVPHHGSLNNTEAFSKIFNYIKDQKLNDIWIRTNSPSIIMGDDYPRISPIKKYCTYCYDWNSDRRVKRKKKGRVIIANYDGDWKIAGKSCGCKFEFSKSSSDPSST